MYGLHVVRGVIGFCCLELRGIRLTASQRFVTERYFQWVIFLCLLLYTEVVRFSEGPL